MKIKYFLFMVIASLFTFVNVYAANEIGIKSITLLDKSVNTTINSAPTYNGLEMNFDVAFKQKDDYAKYKVVIKNDTSTDYALSLDSAFTTSEYITYTYSGPDELKANSEIEVIVTITYTKEVAPALLVTESYTEANKAVVQISNDGAPATPDTTTTTTAAPANNPKTGNNLTTIMTMLVVSLLLVGAVYFVSKKKPFKYGMFAIIFALGLAPFILDVNALEVLKITINVNVKIEKGYKLTYFINTQNILLRDSELKDYNLDEATCRDLYMDTIDDEHKYNYCQGGIVFTDKKMYKYDDTTPAADIEYSYLAVLGSVQKGGGSLLKVAIDNPECEENAQGKLICYSNEVEVKNDKIKNWVYSSQTMEDFGYQWRENDFTTMNFVPADVDNHWNTDHYFEIFAPTTFTMTKHDVVISGQTISSVIVIDNGSNGGTQE